MGSAACLTGKDRAVVGPYDAVGSPAAPTSVRTGFTGATSGAEVLDWRPPSWDEIVREHSGRVYRLAYRLTGNRHDAEDLTQDVFIRVFRSLDGFSPGTFAGWLHRITTNLFLDQVRRKARIRFTALPEDAERIMGSARTPEETYTDDRFDDDVQSALDSLSPDFRVAVVLCDVEGLSYEEVAATLGIKIGTVRSRIHRGRAQLRKSLPHRMPRRAADERAGISANMAEPEASPGISATQPRPGISADMAGST